MSGMSYAETMLPFFRNTRSYKNGHSSRKEEWALVAYAGVLLGRVQLCGGNWQDGIVRSVSVVSGRSECSKIFFETGLGYAQGYLIVIIVTYENSFIFKNGHETFYSNIQ